MFKRLAKQWADYSSHRWKRNNKKINAIKCPSHQQRSSWFPAFLDRFLHPMAPFTTLSSSLLPTAVILFHCPVHYHHSLSFPFFSRVLSHVIWITAYPDNSVLSSQSSAIKIIGIGEKYLYCGDLNCSLSTVSRVCQPQDPECMKLTMKRFVKYLNRHRLQLL